MAYQIIAIRGNGHLLEPAIDYFASRWGIDRRIYEDSISHSLTTDSPLPRWYLLMDGDEIIGSYGLITNDFISRQDLFPWLCALFVEEPYRGKKLGAMLLQHGRAEVNRLGYSRVYLCTDHVGYYEKYGWSYLGQGYHPWGETSRIYVADAILDSTKPDYG
jgi:GNAT superfamily N-acetyltransferase